MYHIRNDKRCLRSAEAISEALGELLDRKPFMDITVTDIQRTAGIGRSTFYRLFDTIDDVVRYIVDVKFREIASYYDVMDMHEFTESCLRGIIDNDGGLINIMSSGRTDLITGSLRENLHRAAVDAGEGSETELQYKFAVFSSACLSVIRVWDENGRKESIEELAANLEQYLNMARLSRL